MRREEESWKGKRAMFDTCHWWNQRQSLLRCKLDSVLQSFSPRGKTNLEIAQATTPLGSHDHCPRNPSTDSLLFCLLAFPLCLSVSLSLCLSCFFFFFFSSFFSQLPSLFGFPNLSNNEKPLPLINRTGIAKRIKADLISKAKIKKDYYKSIGQQRSDSTRQTSGLENDPFFQKDQADGDEDQDGDEEMQTDDADSDSEIEDQDEGHSKPSEKPFISSKGKTKGKERSKDENRNQMASADRGFSEFLKKKDYGKFAIGDHDDEEDEEEEGSSLLTMKPKDERRRLKRLQKGKEKSGFNSSRSQSRPNANGDSNPRSNSNFNSNFNLKSKSNPNQSPKGFHSKSGSETRGGEKEKKRTREESLKIREKRSEKWNSISKSSTGRKRGQPNLGSRMEVLLDRIRESA